MRLARHLCKTTSDSDTPQTEINDRPEFVGMGEAEVNCLPDSHACAFVFTGGMNPGGAPQKRGRGVLATGRFRFFRAAISEAQLTTAS